jgi:transposase
LHLRSVRVGKFSNELETFERHAFRARPLVIQDGEMSTRHPQSDSDTPRRNHAAKDSTAAPERDAGQSQPTASDAKKNIVIPPDLPGCEALIIEMSTTIASQKETIVSQKETILEQASIIADLLRKQFQKHSERYMEDPSQLAADVGEEVAADAVDGLADAVEEAKIVVPEHLRRKPSPKRRNEQLPAHLERRNEEAPVPDEIRFCPIHGERKPIGFDYTETLVYNRPEMWVRRVAIGKFACPGCSSCGVVEPPRAPGLVEGNRYDTSVAAEIVTSKFGFHLPIYRQQDAFAGSGWTPLRSTLLNIAEAAGDLLPPFIDYLKSEALNGGLIGTDDTRVTLLIPREIPKVVDGDAKSKRIHDVFQTARKNKRPSVSARMWAYRSLTVPLNVFDFTVSRHRDGPDDFLVSSEFTGTMIADCYSGYQGITLRSDARIIRAACHAHARRKIFEAKDNHPLLATQMLAAYRQLFDIEDRARDMMPEDRLVLRKHESRPVWDRLLELANSHAAKQVLPKDAFKEPLTYLNNQKDALEVFLSDGRVPIDNNEVEHLMKQVALGRKAWLFIGSLAAGARAANFLTLVSSALRNDLDVYLYVKAVLDFLLAGLTDYASLRPDRWAAAHPQAIRTYRQDERRDRFANQTARRQARREQEKNAPEGDSS